MTLMTRDERESPYQGMARCACGAPPRFRSTECGRCVDDRRAEEQRKTVADLVARVERIEAALAASRAEVERLTAERDEARELKADSESTLKAWFGTKSDIEHPVTDAVIGGLQGYLRTARCGGMPSEQSNIAEAVLVDFCRLQIGLLLTPFITRPLEAAQARIAELEVGLKPFARLAELHDKSSTPDTSGVIFPGSKACVVMGDLRRARSLLSPSPTTNQSESDDAR